MNEITHLFGLVAKIGVVVVILAIVGFVIYMRWRAAGQERGI